MDRYLKHLCDRVANGIKLGNLLHKIIKEIKKCLNHVIIQAISILKQANMTISSMLMINQARERLYLLMMEEMHF